LISSLCTVFDFFSILFSISSLSVQRSNQKEYREKKSKTVQRRNKKKTVQRRNQKQYREEIKNSTEKKSKTV
jgi:hypothetical protein